METSTREPVVNDPRPNPGLGYKLREYLGGGNWKSAYRATSPYSLADVALLFFHNDEKPDVVVKDVTSLLRTISKKRYAEYLARFYGFQQGQDGRFFIIEELIARPLEGLAPLNDLVQFVRIARDLCRGLTCLHESKLVHRDLKLDNCGLDHQQRAKIFDLGSVTSDGGDVRGTIYTRAPELFIEPTSTHKPQCDFASDVWALGATLFALRSDDYPFVHRSEVQERQNINLAVLRGTLGDEDGRQKKETLNEAVRKRIQDPNAATAIKGRIHTMLRGRYEAVLADMLEFNREIRKPIQYFEEEWTALAKELGGVTHQPESEKKWEKIMRHLALAEKKELVLTRKQIERIISEYSEEKPEDKDLAIKKVLELIKQGF